MDQEQVNRASPRTRHGVGLGRCAWVLELLLHHHRLHDARMILCPDHLCLRSEGHAGVLHRLSLHRDGLKRGAPGLVHHLRLLECSPLMNRPLRLLERCLWVHMERGLRLLDEHDPLVLLLPHGDWCS